MGGEWGGVGKLEMESNFIAEKSCEQTMGTNASECFQTTSANGRTSMMEKFTNVQNRLRDGRSTGAFRNIRYTH